VRVGPHDEPAWCGEPLVHHDLVAHPAPADLEVVGKGILLDEASHLRGLLGGGDVLVGNEMIGYEHDLVLLRLAFQGLEFLERQWGRNVVGHYVVNLRLYDLACMGLHPGVGGHYLFGYGL